jgi:hypothetical protein
VRASKKSRQERLLEEAHMPEEEGTSLEAGGKAVARPRTVVRSVGIPKRVSMICSGMVSQLLIL